MRKYPLYILPLIISRAYYGPDSLLDGGNTMFKNRVPMAHNRVTVPKRAYNKSII